MTQVILVVDDNQVTRKLVRFALEGDGYEVIEAATGRLALEAVEARRPDLVLQDLVLPDIDGFELGAMLRSRLEHPRVPLLAFSGLASNLDLARISSVGFDELVVKPVESSQLLKLIKSALPDVVTTREGFGQGRKLIVADDDRLQLKLTAHRLGSLGFDIVAARDGFEALAAARAAKPWAIVSDIMMPELDGFRVCMEVRRDEALCELPVILMTSSYVEEADHALARKAGADACVLRTHDLRELVGALRELLAAPNASKRSSSIPPRAITLPPDETDDEDIDREHLQRVVQQLERQVTLNSGIAQRCSLLASELSILSGISRALSTGANFDEALDEVLASFLDAAGVSTGALLFFGEATKRVRSFGEAQRWGDDRLMCFFDDLEELKALLKSVPFVMLPRADGALKNVQAELNRVGHLTGLVVPVVYRDELLGLLFVSLSGDVVIGEDLVTFVMGVAAQISQGTVLARAFSACAAAERGAREKAQVLNAMMSSISDGIAVVDQDGRYIIWNEGAVPFMKLGELAAGGKAMGDAGFFASDRKTRIPAERTPLRRAIRGDVVSRAEFFIRHDDLSDGQWLSVNASPLVIDGRRQGAVGVFRDVTAEKSAQEQLMISDRMASVGTLAAGVAHEINNPLAAVIANLHLALSSLDRVVKSVGGSSDLDELREDIGDAVSGADRIRNIVRDLKLFSRTDEENTGPVDVQRVIESTLRMAWNEIRHRARLVKDYGRTDAVEASESRLGQVFLNLIVNAAQAIPEGQSEVNEIRVSTRQDPSRGVIIEIADTGSGIAPEVLPRLFTPFFTTKPVGVGTGLGLSICRQIVAGYNGSIEVAARPGGGSVFRVVLPPARVSVEPPPPAVGVVPAHRRGRILVVDDEPMIAKVVQRILMGEHDVTALTSAQVALESLIAGDRFDVILCDLMMPQMTGMDLHAEISRVSPEQADRMIFVTGGAFTERARDFLSSTSNLCVDKPFDRALLRTTVNSRIR